MPKTQIFRRVFHIGYLKRRSFDAAALFMIRPLPAGLVANNLANENMRDKFNGNLSINSGRIRKMADASAAARAASVSFHQLRLFETVGNLPSFRSASGKCNRSQPAVTQALAKLEQQVGATLLTRHASGSCLNDFGMILHRRVARFGRQIEAALADLGINGGQASVAAIVQRLSRSNIRSLIAISEGKSLLETSAMLGVSETYIRRTMHELERSLQKQLYHRSGDNLTVTQAGKEFGRKVKLATLEIEWGIMEVEAALGHCNSKIVIGAMPSGGSVLLASALDDFVTSYPMANVEIISESSPAVFRSLRSGSTDFVIGLLPDHLDEDLVREPLLRTPYVIAGRRGHRLLNRGKIKIEDLLAYDWVIAAAGSSRRAYFDTLFRCFQGPRASVVSSSLPIIRHLLTRSDRLTIMTAYELDHNSSGLVEIPFQSAAPIPTIGVVMRSNWHPTRMHANFLDLIRSRVPEFLEPPLISQLAG